MQDFHNEADTRAKLIDPALHQRGWSEDKIKREETPGAVDVVDGKPRKRSQGRIDYTLRVRVNSDTQPVALALIEAKSEQFSPGHGLQQGKEYAAATKRLNVQFVFSTNGHQVVEYDRITGETTEPYLLSEFPTPDDLRQRYENAQGFSLDDEAKPLLVPYPGGEATRRYYQDAAIRATFEKLAQCEKRGEAKRALLYLATGGPEQKTIIFCVRDTHADEVANAMNNLYARWCADNNRDRVDPYAFKCTAASGGSDYVADLRGASRHHFIATTVDLLSTGVDVPSVKNIVFFKYVRSPIAFYILAELGYGLAPKTRTHRADAFFYKHDQWLNTLPDLTADTL